MWRDFFNLLDNSYGKVLSTLGISNESESHKRKLWFLRLNSTCWNNKVSNTFKSIDQMVSNPKVIACKISRTVQPYISGNQSKVE